MLNTLWNLAFGPRPDWWNVPALIIWALFGNAEDGPYGFIARDEAAPDPNWRASWAWWTRNPLHNLTHHLLSVYFLKQLVLIGQTGDFGLWPTSGRVLLAINGLPCVSIQTAHIEGYAGWRPRVVAGQRVGVFGLALRKR